MRWGQQSIQSYWTLGQCRHGLMPFFHCILGGSHSIINWRAPCKPAPNDYFVAIFQVAPNQLKFGVSTLFVLKNVCVFFPQSGKQGFKHILESSPPPPPLNLPPIDTIFSICFCILEKKNTGTFFNTKTVDVPNLSQFRATWKIATK